MIAILASLVSSLAAKGLDLLSNAVTAKGKEYVEGVLGVNLDDVSSPEKLEELKKLEFEHEEKLQELIFKTKKLDYSFLEKEQKEVSDRWASDNEHGTKFSKLVRPLTLSVLTVAFIFLAFVDGSLLDVNPVYAPIFQTLLMTVYGAYFGLKTLERIKGRKQ